MNDEVRIVWMDDQVKTYRGIRAAGADERGQLNISLTDRNTGKDRVLHFPLRNIRWWGTPGDGVAW